MCARSLAGPQDGGHGRRRGHEGRDDRDVCRGLGLERDAGEGREADDHERRHRRPSRSRCSCPRGPPPWLSAPRTRPALAMWRWSRGQGNRAAAMDLVGNADAPMYLGASAVVSDAKSRRRPRRQTTQPGLGCSRHLAAQTFLVPGRNPMSARQMRRPRRPVRTPGGPNLVVLECCGPGSCIRRDLRRRLQFGGIRAVAVKHCRYNSRLWQKRKILRKNRATAYSLQPQRPSEKRLARSRRRWA